jgi:hypothetical protein
MKRRGHNQGSFETRQVCNGAKGVMWSYLAACGYVPTQYTGSRRRPNGSKSGAQRRRQNDVTVRCGRQTVFTLLDRCISQFRHTQHHIGMIHERLANSGITMADWLGYGEG